MGDISAYKVRLEEPRVPEVSLFSVPNMDGSLFSLVEHRLCILGVRGGDVVEGVGSNCRMTQLREPDESAEGQTLRTLASC